MKLIIHFISFFYMLFNPTASTITTAPANHYSLYCLEIEGRILNACSGKNSECFVELFANGEVIDSLILKEGKQKFKFTLPRNMYYTIRISKKGHVPKLVCINTKMPKGNSTIFGFEFETALLDKEAAKSLNQYVLDFPIAIIYYDEQLECFSYNKDYSETLQRELNTPAIDACLDTVSK